MKDLKHNGDGEYLPFLWLGISNSIVFSIVFLSPVRNGLVFLSVDFELPQGDLWDQITKIRTLKSTEVNRQTEHV